MMIRSAVACFCLATLASAAEFPIGSKIQDLSLEHQGKAVAVSPATATATVVMFTSTLCPISNAYLERMEALHRDYAGKPVQFVFVNSNVNESPAAIDSYIQSNKLAFPMYKDPQSALADRFNAQMTPEAFVFDKNGVLVYHGRIDDSQNPARIQQQSLRLALDAMIAGKPVPVSETRAFGCTIKRPRKTS